MRARSKWLLRSLKAVSFAAQLFTAVAVWVAASRSPIARVGVGEARHTSWFRVAAIFLAFWTAAGVALLPFNLIPKVRQRWYRVRVVMARSPVSGGLVLLLGATAAGSFTVGLVGDARGWFDGRSYLTNLVSSITTGSFGVAVFAVLLSELGRFRALNAWREPHQAVARSLTEAVDATVNGVFLDVLRSMGVQLLPPVKKRVDVLKFVVAMEQAVAHQRTRSFPSLAPPRRERQAAVDDGRRLGDLIEFALDELEYSPLLTEVAAHLTTARSRLRSVVAVLESDWLVRGVPKADSSCEPFEGWRSGWLLVEAYVGALGSLCAASETLSGRHEFARLRADGRGRRGSYPKGAWWALVVPSGPARWEHPGARIEDYDLVDRIDGSRWLCDGVEVGAGSDLAARMVLAFGSDE